MQVLISVHVRTVVENVEAVDPSQSLNFNWINDVMTSPRPHHK